MESWNKNSSPRRIATFASHQIGDTLLATPLYQALRQQFPKAHLTLLTQKMPHEVLAGLNIFNEMSFYDSSVNLKERFDLVVLPVFCGDASVEAEFNANPKTISLAKLYQHKVDGWMNRLDGRYRHWLFYKHYVELNMEIAENLGYRGAAPPLYAPQGVTADYKKWQGYSGVFITTPVTPFQSLPNRQWPLGHWESLIRRMPEKTALIGGPLDVPNLKKVADAVQRPWIVTNTIAEFTALCHNLKLLIVQDGGAMHLAATTAIPIVALFGTGSPILLHPWQPHAGRSISVLSPNGCSPCQRSYRLRLAELGVTQMTCMNNLNPDHVLDAAHKIQSLKETDCLIFQNNHYRSVSQYRDSYVRKGRWLMTYNMARILLKTGLFQSTKS